MKKDGGKIIDESYHEVEAGGFGNDDAQNEEDNDFEELFKDVDVEEVEKDGMDYSGERLQEHAGKSVEESAGEHSVEYNGRMVVSKKVDWEGVNKDRKETGSKGEEIAVLAERSNLRLADRDDLAERVRQVSIELGDSLGYDVLSFF